MTDGATISLTHAHTHTVETDREREKKGRCAGRYSLVSKTAGTHTHKTHMTGR